MAEMVDSEPANARNKAHTPQPGRYLPTHHVYFDLLQNIYFVFKN